MKTAGLCAAVIAMAFAAGCNTAAPSTAQADLERRVEALEKAVTEHADALARRKRNPSVSIITLSKSNPAGACDTAKVVDKRVGNSNGQPVRWWIEDECNIGGLWRVELVFTQNASGQYPFSTLTVRSRPHNRFIQERIKDSNADLGVYSYKIYLVRGSAAPVELADPELEIEPPI